jgi:hypothetical protein
VPFWEASHSRSTRPAVSVFEHRRRGATRSTLGSVGRARPAPRRHFHGVAMRRSTPDGFWGRLRKDASNCWLWVGALGRGGYGKITYHGRTWQTHRLAWVLANGDIPNGLQVNHECDVRPCCNPSHLHLGTQKTNREEAVARKRTASGDRQGLRLHPESRPLGERNGSAKLTRRDVLFIRANRHLGRVALAQRFRVSVAAISFVLTRRTWKHLEDAQ